MDEISTAKRELRERMLRAAADVPAGERARRAAEAHRLLMGLPEVAEARVVLVFSSFGGELSTDDLIPRLAAEGRRLLLPYLDGERLEAAEIRPGEPLAATRYGPKEPADRARVDPSEIGVAVVPGLAFDRSGHRLGRGGGHYDRYLTHLGSHATAVGLGYDFQVVDAVPHTELDRALDIVVTDAGVIRPSPL